MKNIYKKFILVGITSLSLISCNIIDNQQSASIETKLQDIKLSNNIRNYSACIEDGRNFDRLATTKNEEAESLYNKSAKILSDCDLLIKGNPYMINEVERMQNLALSIQNYIKAGNLIQASLNLIDYKNTFQKDLIYKDGSSFIENVETILNHSDPKTSGKFALTNNNRVIRSELKRINYWSKN
jgi:hypothetical protein